MEALEEQFGIDFVDYDAYRYFQPEGFDVFLKRRAKGRGDKAPLTLGIYQADKSSGRDLADHLSGNILAVFSDLSWNNGSFNNSPSTYIWSGRVGAAQQTTT